MLASYQRHKASGGLAFSAKLIFKHDGAGLLAGEEPWRDRQDLNSRNVFSLGKQGQMENRRGPISTFSETALDSTEIWMGFGLSFVQNLQRACCGTRINSGHK